VGVIGAVHVCKRDTRRESPRGTDDPAEPARRYHLRTMPQLLRRRRHRYPLVLLVLFLLYATAWAYHPVDPKDWMLENALAAVFVLALIVSYRRFPLSNVSYTLIFVFLCLHTIGAHYTYSLVPYDGWARRLTGTTINAIFGFQRNHFDRLVHFCFGLLLAYPIRELFLRIAGVRGF
jgi:putative membrane protein